MARASLTHWLEFMTLRAVGGLMHAFDVEQNLHTAGAIGDAYFQWVGRHRDRAIANVRLAFPEWPEARIRATARASMRNMFQLFMVDSLVMPRLITSDSWPRYVHLGPLNVVVEMLARHQPAIYVTGHVGNWELLGFTLAALGFPMTALARPLDNPLINDWALDVREARGLQILTKWGATPALHALIDSGGRVGFIADQNAGDDGLFVPFFGRLASAYKSIGLLAMHHRVPVVAGLARRLDGRFRYEVSCVDIIRPEEWDAQDDPLFYITARYTRAMETMVRLVPEQYLWVHRRWKSRPRHEREGKPFPSRLRAKIEALPWMTPAELDRITQPIAPAELAGTL
jgi:Kdo2-lipid IVA lauroyltransferase/acyltransferase